MATIQLAPAARPVSQILPEQFDLFPDVAEASISNLNPRPAGRSHYRPFSTLYTESPYVELETKAARLKRRASSLGGGLVTMTLGLNFSSKGKKPETSNGNGSSSSPKASSSQFGVMTPILFKVSAPTTGSSNTKLFRPKQPKRPSTAHGQTTKTLAPAPSLKKKRSMASIFTTTSDPTASPVSPAFPSPLMSDSQPETYNPPKREFVAKSMWIKRHNMRLHPYRGEAHYFQAYDPILLESDRYADLLLQRLTNGLPSFYDYGSKPPSKALDLGCGEGHWVLWAASIWKTTEITGFDMVDITLPAFETTENVHFKQGNFLEYSLPFPDRSFDYVRMANLFMCLPAEKWEHIFSEVERVLTKGGRVEFIDDELTFPYADPPVPKNSAMKSALRQRRFEDFFDDTDESDYDNETLQGEGSTEGSTLGGESSGSRPHSYDYKASTVEAPENGGSELSELSASETIRPLSALQHTTILDPTPNIYATPVITDPFFSQSDEDIWQQRSALSRDVEAVFIKMLKDHKIDPYLSQDILSVMQSTFGKHAAGKIRSFKVDLAEWDSPIGPRAMENIDEIDNEKTGNNNMAKRKPWKVVELEMKQKKGKGDGHHYYHKEGGKDKELKENSKKGHSNNRSSVDSSVPEGLNLKAAKRLGLNVTPVAVKGVPGSFNPKAAKRLGIPVPQPNQQQQRNKDIDCDSISIHSGSSSTPSSAASSPTNTPTLSMREKSLSPSPPLLPHAYSHSTSYSLHNHLTQQTIPSAKTAALLGMSYTAVVAASAKATASQRRGVKPEGYVQSPGILIDDKNYVAMDALELEMHACRFMHTLLGCKPALGDYIAQHLDMDGRRIVEDDMLAHYMGEYEAFRRARLGWPSDASEASEADLLVPPTPHWKLIDSSHIGYQPDKPVTIRRIRVFQAVKADDTPTNLFSKISPRLMSRAASSTPTC